MKGDFEGVSDVDSSIHAQFLFHYDSFFFSKRSGAFETDGKKRKRKEKKAHIIRGCVVVREETHQLSCEQPLASGAPLARISAA